MFVTETGGELAGATPDEIDATLNRMVDNISTSYALAYAPTNTANDGKRRRIRVDLSSDVEKREGKVVLRARRSYVMASSSTQKAAGQ